MKPLLLIRLSLGITQTDLARLLGKSFRTIQRWEAHGYEASERLIRALWLKEVG